MNDAKSRRRRLTLALALAVGGSLILAPEALANFLTPKSGGSPNANEIDSLYKIVLYIAAVVFVIVEGALFYSVYKFRAKKNPVAAQIHDQRQPVGPVAIDRRFADPGARSASVASMVAISRSLRLCEVEYLVPVEPRHPARRDREGRR